LKASSSTLCVLFMSMRIADILKINFKNVYKMRNGTANNTFLT
jgi:NifU-like protein involved in Fe-S cluster formation